MTFLQWVSVSRRSWAILAGFAVILAAVVVGYLLAHLVLSLQWCQSNYSVLESVGECLVRENTLLGWAIR